jgi:acetyl-CoA carboxylase carboxyl transferase subunit alpha
MLENSTYSVISPEGAAAILWKDSSLAKQAAETMKITAPDLKQLGVIDEIIPEVKGGAHRDLKKQADEIDQILYRSLQELTEMNEIQLVEQRYQKFKSIGEFSQEKESIGVK